MLIILRGKGKVEQMQADVPRTGREIKSLLKEEFAFLALQSKGLFCFIKINTMKGIK